MACGCLNACGCNVVSDTPTFLTVFQLGDTFHLALTNEAVLGYVQSVVDTNCVNLDVTLGALSATLNFDPDISGGVLLSCTDDGLHGEIILDPATTGAELTEDGLLITVPPAANDDLFIGPTDPGPLGYPYMWIETDGFDNVVTFWVEPNE